MLSLTGQYHLIPFFPHWPFFKHLNSFLLQVLHSYSFFIEYSWPVVPNVFDTRDWFCGRQVFFGSEVRWMVSGWFNHITFIVLFIYNLMLPLIWRRYQSAAQRLRVPALKSCFLRADSYILFSFQLRYHSFSETFSGHLCKIASSCLCYYIPLTYSPFIIYHICYLFWVISVGNYLYSS